MDDRTSYAEALHQSGDVELAQKKFQEAVGIQEYIKAQDDDASPYLYSLPGFRHCNFLLDAQSVDLQEIVLRAEATLKWSIKNGLSLLSVGLDQVTLCKVFCIQGNYKRAKFFSDQAKINLINSGDKTRLPFGLLKSAVIYRNLSLFHLADQDLQETYEIAEPSGMRLHLTDYHLEMARLILAVEADPTQYSEATPDREQRILPFADQEEPGILTLQEHIAEADRLINETGYHRRDAELAELKQQAGMS